MRGQFYARLYGHDQCFTHRCGVNSPELVARQLGDIKLQSQGSYLLAGLTNPHVLYAPAPAKSAVKVDRDGPRLTVVSGGR